MPLGVVKTTYGPVAGVEEIGYSVYKGIPYASPPVGTLRFAPPQRPTPWKQVYEAIQFPGVCPQPMHGKDSFYYQEFYADPLYGPVVDEDCLYLNVWTPAAVSDAKLPVAVWIHGGAFRHGWGHEMEFDGEAYCKRGVVLVTINYRLNVFGFFSHPWLEEHGIAGNLGLLDQIAALEWVQENIRAFGGDSDNVTLMGQSAGSYSVQCLSLMKRTKGLFAKAILQSGNGYLPNHDRILPRVISHEFGRSFAEACGASSLEELRELPAAQLLAHLEGHTFAPIVDGTLLPTAPNRLIESGAMHNIPYLLGCTRNDTGLSAKEAESGFLPALYGANISWVKMVWRHYKRRCYLYSFERSLPGDSAGAFHSSELWYMFGTLRRSWRPMTEHDFQLSETMLDYWCNFMATGNPNLQSLAPWDACENGDVAIKAFF